MARDSRQMRPRLRASGDGVMGIARGVNAGALLGEVICPVAIKGTIAAQGAELEDRFGMSEPSAGAGDVHAVLDQMTASTLDDPGGDGPAFA